MNGEPPLGADSSPILAASPKSVSIGRPSSVSSTLALFRSRCTSALRMYGREAGGNTIQQRNEPQRRRSALARQVRDRIVREDGEHDLPVVQLRAAQDVGMVDPALQIGTMQEARTLFGRRKQLRSQDLEDAVGAVVAVAREPDLRGAAVAQPAQQRVPGGEDLPACQSHCRHGQGLRASSPRLARRSTHCCRPPPAGRSRSRRVP